MEQPQFGRRTLLRGALATAALAGSASLVGCAGSSSETPAATTSASAGGAASASADAKTPTPAYRSRQRSPGRGCRPATTASTNVAAAPG